MRARAMGALLLIRSLSKLAPVLPPASLRAAGYRTQVERRRSLDAAVANLPVSHAPILMSHLGTR